jgi:hypothetical protein
LYRVLLLIGTYVYWYAHDVVVCTWGARCYLTVTYSRLAYLLVGSRKSLSYTVVVAAASVDYFVGAYVSGNKLSGYMYTVLYKFRKVNQSSTDLVVQ